NRIERPAPSRKRAARREDRDTGEGEDVDERHGGSLQRCGFRLKRLTWDMGMITDSVMTYAQPQLLIETDALAARLNDPALRIVDCKVQMQERPGGGFDLIKGFDDWSREHVPGADFIDLVEEISAPHPRLPFMMPDADRFARVAGAHGIG